ncbi:MAG: hypothetical protein ABSB90_06290 [Thermoplasmata archaeon]|jgi:hypothetical protein
MPIVKTIMVGLGLILFIVGFLILPGCAGNGTPYLFFAGGIYLLGIGLSVPPGGVWQLGLGAAIFGTTILVIGYLIGFGGTSCII